MISIKVIIAVLQLQARRNAFRKNHLKQSSLIKYSLRRNLGKWREIGINPFILKVIASGYEIPFLQFHLHVEYVFEITNLPLIMLK